MQLWDSCIPLKYHRNTWQRSEFCKLRRHCVAYSWWSKRCSLHANFPEASRYEVLCYEWHYFLCIPLISGFYSNNLHPSSPTLYILKNATTTHTSPSFLFFGIDVRRRNRVNINTAQTPISPYIYVQITWSETTERNVSQSGRMYSVDKNVNNNRNKRIKKKKTNTQSKRKNAV